MTNFTPLKSVNKAKKQNFLLIFGNIFLVVFIAAVGIFYYNNTLIGNNNRAAKTTATPAKTDAERAANKAKQEAIANGSLEVTKAAKKKEEQAANKAAKTTESNGSCSSGQTYCTVKLTNGKTQGLCISDSSTGGCNGAAVDAGYSVQTGGGGTGSGGWICVVGKNGYTGGQCVEYNSVKSIGAGKPPSCFCGIIQIDGGQYNGTYQSNCGCGSKQEASSQITTLIGTIIPTPTGEATDTPVPTATGAVTPTGTIAPTSTGVPGATLTPVPVLCGTKDCDNKTNPCRSGYSCIQSSDGSNYCASPDFIPACKANPSYNTCCTAPGSATATPTEIVLAKTTVATSQSTPVTGTNSWYMFVFPALAIIGGLIL